MLRITMQSAILLFMIGCLVGCGPREEGAADGGQSTTLQYRQENGVPDPEKPSACDSVTHEIPPLTIAALSIASPIVNVDPFHRWEKDLAEFIIKNPADVPQTVSTLTLDFGELCPVLDTVVLTGPSDALSDGDCRAQTEFTVDTEIPAHGELPLALWGISKTGFESALASMHLKRMGALPGIRPVKIVMLDHELIPDAWSRGPPITVRDSMNEDDQECYEVDDDLDAHTIEVGFAHDDENLLHLVQNRMFFVPFRAYRESSEPSQEDITFRIKFESESVTILGAQVIASDVGALVSQVAMDPNGFTVTIPASYANLYQRFQLLVYAMGSRGVIRFAVLGEEVTCETGATLIGCYPGFSDPYLVLPTDEWEALQ